MTVVETIVGQDAAAPFAIRDEEAHDVATREALLDVCFGSNRNARTCQRLRDGRVPAAGLAFSAFADGRLVGTIRLWNVDAGGRQALVLGPLAVDPSVRALGVGAALMNHAVATARALGHGAIVLLGDAPYYARFGFVSDKAESLSPRAAPGCPQRRLRPDRAQWRGRRLPGCRSCRVRRTRGLI
jgi:predicted N-acetyltransferase YhbS